MQDPTIPQSCSRKQEGFAVKTPRIGLLQLVCPNDDLAHIEAIMLDELDHMLCPLAFDAFLMSFHSHGRDRWLHTQSWILHERTSESHPSPHANLSCEVSKTRLQDFCTLK